MSHLTDMLWVIVYLFLAVLILWVARVILLFPVRNVPDREQEAGASTGEMLEVYAHYRQRCVMLTCIYVLGAAGIAVLLPQIRLIAILIGVFAAFSFVASLMTQGRINRAKRRDRQDTCGQISDNK